MPPLTLFLILLTILFLFFTIRRLVHLFFMNLIIGRKTIKIRKFKKARQYRVTHPSETKKTWLNEQKYHPITISSTKDEIILTAHFLPAKTPKRTFLLFHGWRSNFELDFNKMAEALHNNDCNLLLIEQRAHGNSEGKYIGFGVLERYDCLDWINYLVGKDYQLPIYLAGQSMGASTVLMAAGLSLPPEVKGIIADCGFTSPYEMVVRVAKNVFHLNPPIVNRVARICHKKAGYNLNEHTTLEAMRSCEIPILFVHGTADEFVPYEMTVRNYEACKSPKKLLLIDGASHLNSFAHDTETYLNAIRSFFGWESQNVVKDATES